MISRQYLKAIKYQGPRWDFENVGANYQHCPVRVPIYWYKSEASQKLQNVGGHGTNVSEVPEYKILPKK